MGPEGDLVAARLERGCRCFAVWMGAGVGGYAWFSTTREWIGEIELEIKPRSGEGYVWNCVTLAEHRRKGIFASLLVGVSEIARREGFKRLWIGSVAMPAEKALGPAGFKPAIHGWSLNFPGLFVAWATPAADRALASAALSVLETRAGLRVRRRRARRH